MTTAFLDESQERPVLRSQLSQGVPESIELLRVNRAGWLRNVFVLFAEREKNPPEFLATELIDAGIAREPKEP